MRPKVAVVTSGLGTYYGGIGVVVEMMVSALKQNAEVQIWHHPPFWPRPLRISAIALKALWGSLKRPDLVIYDHVHLASLHKAIPMLRHVPYVVFLHGVEVWLPLQGRRREALLNADLLLSNSSTTVCETRKFNSWLPEVKVTWLGVPGQDHATDVAHSDPVALMVGRMLQIERHKGHDAVIDAWPKIRAAVPDARLMIVGRGDDEPRLRSRVAEEGIEGITFCGRLSDGDRDRMYRNCRLLLLPSRGEGFGLAVVEAASFGIPVLGLAGTVTEELFPDGAGAVFAKSMDGGSVARAAIPVLSDPRYAGRLGDMARARVQSVFLREHFMGRFCQALSPLMKQISRNSNERRNQA